MCIYLHIRAIRVVLIFILAFLISCKTLYPSPGSVVLQKKESNEASKILGQINQLNDQGKYAQAISLAIRLKDLVQKEKGLYHQGAALCLNVLSGLYISFGDFEKAKMTLRQASNIFQELGLEESAMFAITQGLFAKLYMNEGEYEKAEPFALNALEIRERVQVTDHFMISTSQNTLGEIYLNLGEYLKAESMLLRAIELRKKYKNPHGLVISLNNLAKLYYYMGDMKAAEPLADAALELGLYSLGEKHPHLSDTLKILGKIHAAEGRYDQAFRFLKRAQKIDIQSIDNMKGFTSEVQKLKFVQKIHKDLQVFLSLIIVEMPNSQTALKAALNTLLQRKGIILEIQKQFQRALVSNNKKTLDIFSRLSQVRSHLSRMTFSDFKQKDAVTYKEETDRLKKEKEDLEIQLSRISQSYSRYLKTTLVSCESISDKLKKNKDRVLVEITRLTPYQFNRSIDNKWGKDRYIAFILHPGVPDEVQMIDLGDAKIIDALIMDYKTQVSKRTLKSYESTEFFATKLYSSVFKPIKKKLGNIKYIYLSPDSNLNLIPFEVFLDPEKGYLIEDYTFNYLSSGKDILGFKKKKGIQTQSLIIGDPDFNMKLGDLKGSKSAGKDTKINQWIEFYKSNSKNAFNFQRLPETLKEVTTIQSMLGKSQAKLFTGKDATEDVLYQKNAPKILHLATHGFFLKDMVRESAEFKSKTRGIKKIIVNEKTLTQPKISIDNPLLQSGFVLAGANQTLGSDHQSNFDGIITAQKILGLKLEGTQMVVMSACNTGEGEVKTGEGVFGLRRAFIQAGAKSLVMSMWQVPDKETRELMILFYKNILSGKMDRCQALRNAIKSEMIVAKERYGNNAPFYWGAFVFMGDPGFF
jgi:CHAT domain-containing protein